MQIACVNSIHSQVKFFIINNGSQMKWSATSSNEEEFAQRLSMVEVYNIVISSVPRWYGVGSMIDRALAA